MVIVKRKENGYEIRATIMKAGCVTIPKRIREMLDKEEGEFVTFFVPDDQGEKA